MKISEDNKRALEAIRPMAKELNIKVEVDDKFLYCNGQAIGVGCNSAYATIKEFIGYAFLMHCTKDWCFKIPASVVERIKRYWFTPEQWEMVRQNADG